MNAVPLGRYERFSTDSLEYVRGAMTSAYCKHGIVACETHTKLAARHNQANLAGLSLNYLTYGLHLTVAVPELPDFFLVEFPLSGRIGYRVGSREWKCDGLRGTILGPGASIRSEWLVDSAVLTLKIECRTVERVLADLLDKPLTSPVRFEPLLDCASGAGASFRAFVLYLVTELDEFDGIRHLPLWPQQLERTIVTALLTTQRHTFSADLEARATGGGPGCVRKAETFIRDNLTNAITMQEVIAASGVPERTLYSAYKKHRGKGPMAHHRALRLQAARHDLQHARTSDTVASIACRWGFFHFGNFSRDYCERFGEKPYATLKAHR